MPIIYSQNHRLGPTTNARLDPFRPLQLIETVKDAFQIEIKKFFQLAEVEGRVREEIPTIEKFRTAECTENVLQQQVNIIRQLPDISQNLPIIAVTTAIGKTRMLGIGTQYLGLVQDPPRVKTTIKGPYAFMSPAQLTIKTNLGPTTISMTSAYIDNLTIATTEEIVSAINNQTERLEAKIDDDGQILILAKADNVTSLEIVPSVRSALDPSNTQGGIPSDSYLVSSDGLPISGIGHTQPSVDAAPILGLVGQSDDISNPARPPKHRYYISKELTVNLDIGANSDNGRTEIMDLLSYFFELRLEERDFHFSGDVKNASYFQIILRNEMTITGESEIPRSEGDAFDKIYVNRISVPVTIIDYIDRPTKAVFYEYADSLSLGADTNEQEE